MIACIGQLEPFIVRSRCALFDSRLWSFSEQIYYCVQDKLLLLISGHLVNECSL